MRNLELARKQVSRISASGLTIYDDVEIGGDCWIPSDLLEVLLQTELEGHRFESAALRTRSKLAKERVCGVLGYPLPKVFKRVRPRFSGQNFDVYVQAADNLQIWNEEVSPARRYVLIRPDAGGVIRRVKVVAGADLAPLDRTGRLTRKYQARVADLDRVRLASSEDAPDLIRAIGASAGSLRFKSPVDLPESATLRPIAKLFALLAPLVGRTFDDPGILQERNRGGRLHGMVSAALGYGSHADNGKFPDIRHQLLEVKLQTSPTIDLGAISPDSGELLEFPALGDVHVRHHDVRYAVFCGSVERTTVTITGLTLVTGRDFFGVFERFGGQVINNKYQLPLPRGFFDRNTEGIFD